MLRLLSAAPGRPCRYRGSCRQSQEIAGRTTVMLRYFESNGQLRRAITVVKSRTASHALTIHEFKMHTDGIEIGVPLEGFVGVLSGLPTYRGSTAMLESNGDAAR